MTDVLSHVTEGTAPNAKLPDDRPLAGKTGTRDDETDAWFAGYTPQLTAVVWMGDPRVRRSRPRHDNVGGVRVYGGTYPRSSGRSSWPSALADQPIMPFSPPDETLWPEPARVNPAGGRESPSGRSRLRRLVHDDLDAARPTTTTSSTGADHDHVDGDARPRPRRRRRRREPSRRPAMPRPTADTLRGR